MFFQIFCTSLALQIGLSRESLHWCLRLFQLSKDFLLGKGPVFPEEPLTEKSTEADGRGKHRASCSAIEDLDGGKVQEDIFQRQDTGVKTILEVEKELIPEKCRDEQREDGHEEVPLTRSLKRKLLPSQQGSKNENHGNPKEGKGGNKSRKSSNPKPLINIDSPAKRLRKRDDSGRAITKGSPSRGGVLPQGESELPKRCPTVVTDEEVGTIFKDLDSEPDQSKFPRKASRGNKYIAPSDVDSDAETQVYVDQKPRRLLLLFLFSWHSIGESLIL